MHVVFKATTNPECVPRLTIVFGAATTPIYVAAGIMVIGMPAVPAALLRVQKAIVYCAKTAITVATLVLVPALVVVGILPVPAARFKLRVPWNATNQEKSP